MQAGAPTAVNLIATVKLRALTAVELIASVELQAWGLGPEIHDAPGHRGGHSRCQLRPADKSKLIVPMRLLSQKLASS